MTGGQSQSDRVLISAFNDAIEARAKVEFQRSKGIYDDTELTQLDNLDFYATRAAKDALRNIGINPAILVDILL